MCPGPTDSQVGIVLFLRENCVAQIPGWREIGFADGAAETGSLDPTRQPWVSTANDGLAETVRLTANADGLC